LVYVLYIEKSGNPARDPQATHNDVAVLEDGDDDEGDVLRPAAAFLHPLDDVDLQYLK
jgi:hypothetical protein